MGLKILFDVNHNPVFPTIVLANRNGNKLGVIDNCCGLQVSDVFIDNPTISFKVPKMKNNQETALWDSIVDFKLVWCKEWDYWFQISVELEDGESVIKSVNCVPLSQAELGQINIYDVQINTEEDIARDDYSAPTVIYNAENPNASLLHRIMYKTPHYSIKHVDSTLAGIQRVFEFNGTSVQDGLNQVATEIGALIVYGNGSKDDTDGTLGKIPERTISLYDLETNCLNCGYRGEFENTCPKCGSTNIQTGYGEDTTIFVSKDNLTDEVTLSVDVDNVKNCFHLVAGDEGMNAAIRSCNPNGTDYIWHISDSQKADMGAALVAKLDDYDDLLTYYTSQYNCPIDSDKISVYNTLVDKYSSLSAGTPTLPLSIVGYSSLMNCLYDVVDFYLVLDHSLMPVIQNLNTTAQEQADLLTVTNLSPCAVSDISSVSQATADSAVLSVAKVLVNPTYQVKINASSFNAETKVWSGNFIVTNYSNDADTATSLNISISITGDFQKFVNQKLDKALKNSEQENYDITGLFAKSIAKSGGTLVGDFVEELKKYGLSSLKTFYECAKSCVDILVEQGVSDKKTWRNTTPNLYSIIYLKYYYKMRAIEREIAVREQELATINDMMNEIESERKVIQNALDFEDFLGTTLWKEFCAYRREGEYSNNNYVSDGLTNSELFSRARDFIEAANKELYKSSTLQHQISSTLKNLLVIPQFEKLVDYFEVGNWIRIEIDGAIYKLRLLQYDIDFDNLETLNVDFSDVLAVVDGRTDVFSILSKASSMATTYSAVAKQANKGEVTFEKMDNWFTDGLDATLTKIVQDAKKQDITWDSHGMLFRQYDDITESYSPEQLKIINSTIAVTDDNWETTRTAVGKFYYYDSQTNELKTGYGVNAELLVGKMIVGESLALYNSENTMTFDSDGLTITNGVNEFSLNPNAERLLVISNDTTDLLYFDSDGNLTINGSINADDGTIGGWKINETKLISTFYNTDESYKITSELASPKGRFVSYAETQTLDNPIIRAVSIGGSTFVGDVTDVLPKLSIDASLQEKDSNGNLRGYYGYSITPDDVLRYHYDSTNGAGTVVTYHEYSEHLTTFPYHKLRRDYTWNFKSTFNNGVDVDITEGGEIALKDESELKIKSGTGRITMVGNINVPNRQAGDDSTQVANTAYVKKEAERIINADFVNVTASISPAVTIAAGGVEVITVDLELDVPYGYKIKTAIWRGASWYAYCAPMAIDVDNNTDLTIRLRNFDTESREISQIRVMLVCVPI